MRFKIKQYLIFAIFSNKNKFVNVCVRVCTIFSNMGQFHCMWLLYVSQTNHLPIHLTWHVNGCQGHLAHVDCGYSYTLGRNGDMGRLGKIREIWRPPGLMVGWGHRNMHGCWRRSCHGHRLLSHGKGTPAMSTHISNHLHEYELSCRKVSSEIVLLGQKFKLPIANAGPSTLTRLQNHSKSRNDLEPRKLWCCEALTQTQHNTTRHMQRCNVSLAASLKPRRFGAAESTWNSLCNKSFACTSGNGSWG